MRALFLHGVARIAIRILPPLGALRLVRTIARSLPGYRPLGSSAAIAIGESMRRRGTCLTRSIALASQVQGAGVALGVRRGSGDPPFHAHAWAVKDGQAICRGDPDGEVIAVLE
ncbi:MAG: lasso peptide biosynthesis B2 protein [Polyangiaceae bacterium]